MNTSNLKAFLTTFFIIFNFYLSISSLNGQVEYKDDTLNINGFEFYYKEAGQGMPLLLLHGFTQTGTGRNSWGLFVDSLAKEYRVIIPDMRGHGRSTNPSGEFTHRQYAQDVYALLNQLQIDTFYAMGFSSGGMTLLHMSISQTNRIKAMIIIGATSNFDNQTRNAVAQWTYQNVSSNPAFLNLLRQEHTRGGDKQIEWVFDTFSNFKNSQGDVNFSPEELKTIKAETLIVHGDHDPFFSVRSSALVMYENIPKTYLWIVPGTGHNALVSPSTHSPFLNIVKNFFHSPK